VIGRTQAARAMFLWRCRKNVSQQQAAEICGIATREQWCQYERGIHRPDRENALKIERGTAGAVPVEAWDEPCAAVG
jgi:transcriptional regulator with XRE-family HTH domain